MELLKSYSTNLGLRQGISKFLETQRDSSCTDRLPNDVWNPTRKRKRMVQLSDAEVADLARRYQAGETVYQLAKRFDVHRGTVSKLLERAGVARHYRVLDKPAVDRAAGLYRSGWSLKRVATEMGVTAETVRRAFLTQGVSTRRRQGWPE